MYMLRFPTPLVVSTAVICYLLFRTRWYPSSSEVSILMPLRIHDRHRWPFVVVSRRFPQTPAALYVYSRLVGILVRVGAMNRRRAVSFPQRNRLGGLALSKATEYAPRVSKLRWPIVIDAAEY